MRHFPLRQPTPYELALVELFTQQCVSTNIKEYSRRNQDNIDKVKRDIKLGKIAELLVFDALKKAGKNPIGGIDLQVYGKEYKTYDVDIVTPVANVHVKSCDGTTDLPNSWVFQPNDPITMIPTDKDFLALVVLGKKNYFYLIPAKSAIYKPPLKQSLRKKVIYEVGLTESFA